MLKGEHKFFSTVSTNLVANCFVQHLPITTTDTYECNKSQRCAHKVWRACKDNAWERQARFFNPLSANSRKWSNTLKQFISEYLFRRLPQRLLYDALDRALGFHLVCNEIVYITVGLKMYVIKMYYYTKRVAK